MTSTLWVGGDKSVFETEEILANVFSPYGKVINVSIKISSEQRKHPYAFVQLDSPKSATKAQNALNGSIVNGRPLR